MQEGKTKINSGSSPIKAGIGYSIANIIIKSIGVLSLPIFSRLLSTSEYGIYSVFMSYTTIMSYVIGLTLNVSIKRANIEFPNAIDKYVSTVSVVYKINLLLVLLFVLLFGNSIVSILDLSLEQMILMIICAEGTAYLALYNAKISLKYSYKEYMVWAAINSIGSILLSLFLILTIFSSNHLLGRLLGSTIVLGVSSVILTIKNFTIQKPSFNKDYLKFGIKYSLPIVPNGIAQVLLAQFDRVMIKRMVDDSSAGIYSFASNVKLILTVLVDSIGTVWSTYFFDTLKKNETLTIRKKATEIVLFFLILTIGLIGISPEIIRLLGTADYLEGRYVVIPMVFEGFVLLLYSLIVQGEYYAKKTVFVFIGTFLAAVLNVVLNYFFIKHYGYIAAAYTTLFAYFMYLILHIIISKKVVGFYIVPLKYVLFSIVYLGGFSIISLLLVDLFIFRLCAIIIFLIPIIIFLNSRLIKFEGNNIWNYLRIKLLKKD